MSEQILPFYLVCDESGSMQPLINRLNSQLLVDLHHEIGSNPVVADKTRFSIIGFAENARVLLPLADLSELSGLPALKARGTTSYRSAFELLRQEIDRDVASLKAAGNLVYRPVVFFLSDGQPTDSGWLPSLAQVTAQEWKYRPNIIAFGLGDVDEQTIRAVGTFRAFTVDNDVNPATALAEFARALTTSIVKSGSSATARGISLQVQKSVPGFTSLEVDAL